MEKYLFKTIMRIGMAVHSRRYKDNWR